MRSCLRGLGETFHSIGLLPGVSGFSSVVEAAVGLDGRAIRKAVASALTMRKEVAMNPMELTVADLLAATKAAKAIRMTKEKAK